MIAWFQHRTGWDEAVRSWIEEPDCGDVLAAVPAARYENATVGHNRADPAIASWTNGGIGAKSDLAGS
jgi:hypothetical protein